MTRVRQSPLMLLLALLALFAATAESQVMTTRRAKAINSSQFCTACRDTGDCSKAHHRIAGKFCYDYVKSAIAIVKTACCCGKSVFVCSTPNATTTECVCNYVEAQYESSGGLTIVWVMIAIGFVLFTLPVTYWYVRCQKKQAQRMMAAMQEAQYQSTMVAVQQHQLQTDYNNNMQYGGQQQQPRGYAGL